MPADTDRLRVNGIPVISCPPSEAGEVTMGGVRLTLRVDFGTDRAIGPGKVLLLERIRDTGSISQAGRSLGMSYRRAWLLVDDMNRCFREPVVLAQPGGAQGGGAALTAFGQKVVQKYRAIETQATAAARPQLHDLAASLRAPRRRPSKAHKTSIRAGTAR
jgi:molybdate transport system regulatory protein